MDYTNVILCVACFFFAGLGFIGYGLVRINRHTRPDTEFQPYQDFAVVRDGDGKAKVTFSESDVE